MIKKLILSFDYCSIGEFWRSLIPSIKYGATGFLASVACVAAFIEGLLGISKSAFVALCIIMVFELISGLTASRVKGVKISSVRWSRFGLKVGLWFMAIYVTHIIAEDFQTRNLHAIAAVINWTHTALILSIFFEYLLSVLENIATISGNDNATIINKIKEKFKQLL